MAINYHLKIDTKKSINEILDIILQIKGFEENDGENNFFANGLVGGVWAESHDYDSQISQNLTEEDFGFRHNIVIWLTPYSDELEEDGMQNLIKAIVAILKHNSGNAVVLMNGEYIILTRLSGQLVLNSEDFGEKDKWWNPKKDIPFSDYELRKLGYVGQ